MGTRSSIQVMSKEQNKTVIIYKHWDGYPSDNLKMLNEAFEVTDFKRFLEKCAFYYERPLFDMIQSGSEKITTYKPRLYNSKKYCQHGDLEYFYIVNLDTREIIVYSGYGSESELVNYNNTKIDLKDRNLVTNNIKIAS